jgi:hypothetical protein
MLASITPLGQWGRRSRWRLTAASFLTAAAASGAGLGALLGLAGSAAVPASVGAGPRLAALAATALLALSLDLVRPLRAPGPRRQVNERWRYDYRGWVYGAGYGVQLGIGVATVISSAATYLALVGAFLSAGAGRGALILGIYGATRGLQPLITRRVAGPQQLLELHGRLARWRAPARRVTCGALLAIVALALLGALT